MKDEEGDEKEEGREDESKRIGKMESSIVRSL